MAIAKTRMRAIIHFFFLVIIILLSLIVCGTMLCESSGYASNQAVNDIGTFLKNVT